MQQWLEKHKYLWWWVKDTSKLSKISQLFEKMTSQRRVNLRQSVRILFQDYLQAHAQ